MKKFLLSLLLISNVCFANDMLWHHDGGESLDKVRLYNTIDSVLETLPAGKIEGMRDLVRETLEIETLSGLLSYDNAAINWNNYGIAQIRADTAEWLLGFLYKNDRNRFSEVYKYYDPETSMQNNLLSNVPFSIAVCAELYAYRLKGKPINSMVKRARAWKVHYNTVLGAGTVEGYIKKNS